MVNSEIKNKIVYIKGHLENHLEKSSISALCMLRVVINQVCSIDVSDKFVKAEDVEAWMDIIERAEQGIVYDKDKILSVVSNIETLLKLLDRDTTEEDTKDVN